MRTLISTGRSSLHRRGSEYGSGSHLRQLQTHFPIGVSEGCFPHSGVEESQGIFPGSEAERRSADGLEKDVLPSGPLKRFLRRLVLKSVLDREKS